MLIHHFDSNPTWVEPLKNQTERFLIAARAAILEQMRRQGIIPKHQILDNQCSARMKLAMEATVLLDRSTSKMKYELVPLYFFIYSLTGKRFGQNAFNQGEIGGHATPTATVRKLAIPILVMVVGIIGG
jgi:hypothetical protein